MKIFVLAVMLSGSLMAQCRLAPKDESALKALPGAYRDGWFAADAEASVMKLFMPDAMILPHHGVAPRKGHAEIKKFWFPPNMASFQLLKLTMDPVEISGCGNIAYISGNQSVEWKMKESPQITFNAGTFLLIARKEKGQWLIDRLMWDDPPNQTR